MTDNYGMDRLSYTDKKGRPLYRMNPQGKIVRTQKITKATRRKVLERDSYCCVICGGTEPHLELDHIVAYVDGGGSAVENLRTLCEPCHKTKSAEDWRCRAQTKKEVLKIGT